MFYFCSTKTRRFFRPVLGAKNFGMADTWDAAIIINLEVAKILKKKLKIKILTDSEILFNLVIKNSFPTEIRRMIDINATRETYNKGIVNDFMWIRRKHNIADAMIKHTL